MRFHSPSDMARVSTGYVGDKGFTSFGEFPWHVSSDVTSGDWWSADIVLKS